MPDTYLAQDVDIVVVILVLLPVFVLEDDLLLGVVDGRLEYLVGPLVLAPPAVVLVLILKVVVADVRIPIGHTDIDAFVLEHPGDLPQHLLGVLLGVGTTLSQ